MALGIGNRALRESLAVAHRERGAGGEQTVEGLLADTATELDAARLLTWKAAGATQDVSLADASMAKLAAAAAAQAAVVAGWAAGRQESPTASRIMLAHTRADVAALNQLARERLREAGAR